MSQPVAKSIDVFLTLDQLVVEGYFNKHDPAPIYKRQLSHQFVDYIMTSVKSAKRHSVIFYKLKCKSELDKQYAEPVMYAVKSHFKEKLEQRERQFTKFKRRSWMVLAISISVVVIFHSILPFIMNEENAVHTGLVNSLDIFSWVMLWHPIDELIFHWNPHLKDIALLRKLATSEVIILANAEKKVTENKLIYQHDTGLVVNGAHRLSPKAEKLTDLRDRALL